MKRLVRRARQAAPFSEAVFIEGESGTGKELLAEAIHQESPRRGKPFVEVNCGAIPKDLFESSFFGHTKGAFTGATATRRASSSRRTAGTLFLDEVGELPLERQVKLLRALQEKKVRPRRRQDRHRPSTCASSPPPTATCRGGPARGASARTSTTASPFSF